MTTYRQVIDGVLALNVPGVKKVFPSPPAGLNTSDLPALWVQFPKGTESALTFGVNGGWTEFSLQLVIAFSPVSQGTQESNFDGTLAIIDNLTAALRAGRTARGGMRWEISQGSVNVSGTDYWAVIADVTING